ncbi:MAG: hypothetical protein M1133_02980 [Armatimonadetes bacterium]|nr:hypothetical protein [Armatimonadota bacterium]
MSHFSRIRFILWSRPIFRTCEIVCNHAARIFEKRQSLAKARADLEELNRKRMQYQRILNRIGSSHDHVCAECKGKCCGGARERDAFTDRVIQHPETPHRTARRKEGRMAAYEVEWNGARGTTAVADCEVEPVEGYCPELTTRGCRIPYELRPIQCTAYFCNATVNELSKSECRIGSKALVGLMKVQVRTALLALRSRGS